MSGEDSLAEEENPANEEVRKLGERLCKLIQETPQQQPSLLEQLGNLAELIGKGVVVTSVVPQILKLVLAATGADAGKVVRHARDRWKMVVDFTASERDWMTFPRPQWHRIAPGKPLPPEGNWHFFPIDFREELLGVVALRRPVLPLNEDQKAVVRLLSMMLAFILFSERTLQRELTRQREAERDRR